jgi:hypothetical protein
MIASELAEIYEYLSLTITLSVKQPVFVVDGQDDNIFCGAAAEDCLAAAALLAAEAPNCSSPACVQAAVIPEHGARPQLEHDRAAVLRARPAVDHHSFAAPTHRKRPCVSARALR